MKVSKGMPLLAAIAAIMVVSYTVFRLQYAANHLPYDPGDPFPRVTVVATTPDLASEQVLATFQSHHSVFLTGMRPNGTIDAQATPREFDAWPLRGLERERAILKLEEQTETERNRPSEQRDRNSCLQLARLVAMRKLLELDRVFVLELIEGGDTPPWPDSLRWHVDSLLLFQSGERLRMFCCAIDSEEFGFVSDALHADPKTFDPR